MKISIKRNLNIEKRDAMLEQMAKEQGVPPFDIDEVLAMIPDDWTEEDDVDEFLEHIRSTPQYEIYTEERIKEFASDEDSIGNFIPP